MKHPTLFLISALVLGFAIGVALDFAISGDDRAGAVDESLAHHERRGPSFTRTSDRMRGPLKTGEGADAASGPEAVIRRLLKQIEQLPRYSSVEAEYLAYGVIRTMDEEEILHAIGELEKDSYEGTARTSILMQLLLDRYSELDNDALLDYALASSKGQRYRENILYGALGNMARHDPRAARAWLREHGEENLSYDLAQTMDQHLQIYLARQSVDAAIQEIDRMQTKSQKRSATLATASALGSSTDLKERERFVQYLNDLEDEDTRQDACKGFLKSLAGNDPQAAITYLNSFEFEGTAHQKIEDGILEGWSKANPEAAFTWRLENLGEGEALGTKDADRFGLWTMRSPEEAVEWLSGQRDGAASDEFYRRSSQYDLPADEGVRFATLIRDQAIRRELLERSYRKALQVMGAGGPQVSEWIQGFEPEIREELLEIASKKAGE